MSVRAPYPNALILAHPNLSHAAALEICHREGLRIIQTKRGNYIYEPAAPQSPGLSGSGLHPALPAADAAGTDPEAA